MAYLGGPTPGFFISTAKKTKSSLKRKEKLNLSDAIPQIGKTQEKTKYSANFLGVPLKMPFLFTNVLKMFGI